MLFSFLAFAALVQAQSNTDGSLIRFGCSQVVIDRIDPLVNPGQNPSPHIHQVIGGNAFNVSIPSTDVSTLATCTTCTFAEDTSNYWTANLYFKARNGSYKRVPQIANRGNTGETGGFTVYYTSPGKGKTTAFKPGFRMLVGDPMRREAGVNPPLNFQSCFRCYSGPDFKGDDLSPCFDPKVDTESFPQKMCSGIRTNLLFPTCWDGKNLDSPDHKTHIAYPSSGPDTFFVAGGACPSTHPVRIPQVMLEIVWDTTPFNDKSIWPEDGSQPFVLSTGDPTGFGQHGDYVFGWKGDALQRAMDGACMGATCSNLKVQAYADANKCTVPKAVHEDTEGWMPALPGTGN
ncbi:hypothetical protein EG329_002590 [Mollisiaceae sp. DMI_Dod_QoI]|nr:hypothetical protein EG329_002590 [Helotiales sp. DMI_Dod_QoI]